MSKAKFAISQPAMACDQPARTRHPALGAAAVERTRVRRRRGGRLSKPSVSVEAPHLVVERTRRGVAATLHGVPRRQHGVRRRCGRHDGPFGARSFHQHVAAHAPGRVRLGDCATFFAGPPKQALGRVELLSNEPHALGRREPLRVDAARRDTSSTSTSRLADEACAGSTATNPRHGRDVVPKRVFAMEWKVEYSGRG